jgi:hypothetical protein
MKVGDLVSVKLAHGRNPILGLILEIYDMKGITASMQGHALVQPCDPTNRLTWANPVDVEVLNEAR